MKVSKLRTVVAVVAFCVLAIGLIAGINLGTMSAFGPGSISAFCPLGAFTTMVSTKTVVPRAVVSIIIMALLVLVVGRAYCGWICPVSWIEKIKNYLRSPKKRKEMEKEKREECVDIANFEIACKKGEDCSSCNACKKQKPRKLDSRHYVLFGALLATLIFGFPVFCMICPIGLSFATVVLIYRLFAFGDTTWSVVVVPIVLILEMTVFKKWCGRWCPMAGLMNLVSRFSKTIKPTIDESKCIETQHEVACSRCAVACPQDINLRHPEYGEHTLADCARCFECVDACPQQAISMPLVYKKDKSGTSKVTIAENVES